MMKNQSIKSFFSASANSANKQAANSKSSQDEIKKEEIVKKEEKNTKEEKPKVVEKNSDSDFDSPIKQNKSTSSVAASGNKKRKLILESDDSEPDEIKIKTPKKSSNNVDVKTTSSAAANKENNGGGEAKPAANKSARKTPQKTDLRLSSSSESEIEEVEIEEKKPAKKTEKAAKKETKKKSPKSKKQKNPPKNEKEEEEVLEVKEEEKMEKSPSPSPKKKESPKKEKESPKKEPIEVKQKDIMQNFFSKSTSVFANGKKVQNETTGSKLSDSASSESKSVYNPSKDDYHPIKDASWDKGAPVPYQALAQTLYCMERTTKRLELLSIVSNYFRSLIALSPKDLVPSIFMLTNKVAPDYESIELGIGDTVLFKALAEATGCTVAKLKSQFQEKGDIGLVAEANRCTQKLLFTPKKLTVGAVFQKLKEIASIAGNSSQAKKCDLIKNLLVSCDSVEARYLMRSLAGKLRNGLGEQSILTALGHAFATTHVLTDGSEKVVVDSFEKLRKHNQIDEIKKALEEPVQDVKQAYYQCPNYDMLIETLVKYGVENVREHCQIVPGIPLKPMLAYPTKGIHEVLKRFDQALLTCEYKYDGERAQIHILEDGSVRIYSRNSENNTSKYPDIIEFLQQDMLKLKKKTAKKNDKEEKDDEKVSENKVTSAIIDAEVVAYDTEKHIIQPFQKLTTRKRKDAASEDIKVQVCIFAFDLIYLNGKTLIDDSLRERREKLQKYFPKVDTKFMYAENIDTNSSETIQEFLDKSIKDGCEGLMIKTLDEDAHYEISKRSHNWLKLKKDYLDGVGDTLDLVVIGGYLGTGKRTGVYGGYLLACYDKDNEEYQTICKLGTGLKDNDLQSLYESLNKVKIDKPKSYYRVNRELEQPDVWFEAEQVWEIKCADFSLSPVHTAACGMIDSEKGVSMRFPRFLRVRDDKKPEDATSSEQVVDMYKNQQQMINLAEKAKDKSDNEDDLE